MISCIRKYPTDSNSARALSCSVSDAKKLLSMRGSAISGTEADNLDTLRAVVHISRAPRDIEDAQRRLHGGVATLVP